MVNKFFLWCGNALLASILVLVVSVNPVWSQETGDETADSTDDSASDSGRISVPLSGTATVTVQDLYGDAKAALQSW